VKIAVIPARGGSKRIPHKNVRPFCGKPMIAWPIAAARESGCFDHIVVSTDDEEIARIALSHGAEVPFVRPAELSDDYTATRPVVIHAIREAEKLWGHAEFICCIYATSPFMTSTDIRNGLDVLVKSDADFAFAVTTFPYPIQRALKRTAANRVAMFHPEHRLTRSQDLEEAYHDAGQFYWGRTRAFLEDRPTFSDAAIPIVLPRSRVQDIDTLEDWRRAELMFEALARAEKERPV
jgi:N-acylneuraminate cytidylyltransferase